MAIPPWGLELYLTQQPAAIILWLDRRSLAATTTGSGVTVIGALSGSTNTTGSDNTFLGVSTDASSNNLSNATAIGANAVVTASNTIQLGNDSVTQK